jgi:hypothetical protein
VVARGEAALHVAGGDDEAPEPTTATSERTSREGSGSTERHLEHSLGETAPTATSEAPGAMKARHDTLPDVRDGLTRLERLLLVALAQLQTERPGRPVPSAQLYGRLCEQVHLSPAAFEALLARLARRPAR